MVHICKHHKYPIADPLMHGLMLDVDIPEGEEKIVDNWPEGYQNTFIVWERGPHKSAFSVQGSLQEVRLAGQLLPVMSVECSLVSIELGDRFIFIFSGWPCSHIAGHLQSLLVHPIGVVWIWKEEHVYVNW